MLADWSPLKEALKSCRAAGLSVPIWWRDDDAVAPTDALDRLSALAGNCDLPVHCAVIPGRATPDLATTVRNDDNLIPLVHGWRHDNHAPASLKKSEFGQARKGAVEELGQALARMQELFGAKALPIFVPPWNRIDPVYFPVLSATGYKAVSTFAARESRFAFPGLLALNTHVDPIDWRGSRDLRSPDTLIAETAAILLDRLHEKTDASEPLGYLTHHLVHSQELWEFSHRYLSELLDGGAMPQPLAPLLETLDEPT